MSYLQQVQRGIDYIEENLDFDIESAEVARRAGISQWHFQRIFKGLTNETLKTYIRSRRLANALDKLSSTKTRILEIALAAGFDSQAAFTRAFKKAFGVTPASYRRRGQRFQFLRKARFDAEYLTHIHQGVSLEPELYEQSPMMLVGLRTRFYSVDSEKNNLAEKLPALWSAFLARLGEVPHRVEGICYGVVQQTRDKTDELDYLAAVQVTHASALAAGFVGLELAAGRYAKFLHRGDVARVDQTVSYIYSSWLARSGMRHTYAADLETYDARYHPTSPESVIGYSIPIAPE